MRTEVFTRIVTSVSGWTAQRSKGRDSRSQDVAIGCLWQSCGRSCGHRAIRGCWDLTFAGLARNATRTNACVGRGPVSMQERIDMYRGKMGNFRICMSQGAGVAPVRVQVCTSRRGPRNPGMLPSGQSPGPIRDTEMTLRQDVPKGARRAFTRKAVLSLLSEHLPPRGQTQRQVITSAMAAGIARHGGDSCARRIQCGPRFAGSLAVLAGWLAGWRAGGRPERWVGGHTRGGGEICTLGTDATDRRERRLRRPARTTRRFHADTQRSREYVLAGRGRMTASQRLPSRTCLAPRQEVPCFSLFASSWHP